MRKTWLKRVSVMCMAALLTATGVFTSGCSAKKQDEQVVIYSNADDEAVEAMKKALDGNGYKGKYILQTFGTSELGGKLIAEGKNIEADMVTMSTFYIESAQKKNKMFADLGFDRNLKKESDFQKYESPITA